MAKNKDGRVNIYKLNDRMNFMTADQILDSEDENLQNEFFHYLDKLNDLERSADGIGRELYTW